MSPTPPPAPDESLFRRDYTVFLTGRFLGTLATSTQSVVIAWEVYGIARRTMEIKEAAFAVGMIGLVQFLPLVALTLVAGEAADRHSRRLILVLCYTAQLLTSTALAVHSALVGELWPVFARDILHVGPEGFGVLRAAPAAGAVLVGAFLAVRPIRRRIGVKMLFAVALFGVMTLVFAFSELFVLSVCALVILGGADMVSVFTRQCLVQIATPDPMRGRVSAVSTLFIGASNELGEFESGVVARFLGPVWATAFGGPGRWR